MRPLVLLCPRTPLLLYKKPEKPRFRPETIPCCRAWCIRRSEHRDCPGVYSFGASECLLAGCRAVLRRCRFRHPLVQPENFLQLGSRRIREWNSYSRISSLSCSRSEELQCARKLHLQDVSWVRMVTRSLTEQALLLMQRAFCIEAGSSI